MSTSDLPGIILAGFPHFLPLPYTVLCKLKNKNLGMRLSPDYKKQYKTELLQALSVTHVCTQTQRWQVWVNFWTVKIIFWENFWLIGGQKNKNKRLFNPAVGMHTQGNKAPLQKYRRSSNLFNTICAALVALTLCKTVHFPSPLLPPTLPLSLLPIQTLLLPSRLPLFPSPSFSPSIPSFSLCISFLPSGIR